MSSGDKKCPWCESPCRSTYCRAGNHHLTVQMRAHKAVSDAVKSGNLVDLKTNEVKCSDCDSRALNYDHRDYRKPLDVEPVCRSCNCRRGPAIDIAHIVTRGLKKKAASKS